MKKHVMGFLRRGFRALGIGPIVLAVLYLILYKYGRLETLTIPQVCIGIFSLSALAFMAGGLNVLYQIERLPTMAAVAIHGSVLYISYLITYLLNDWLEWGTTPMLVFTGIFILGYLAIWAIIYSIIKRNTQKLNAALKQKQQVEEEKQ